MEAVNAVAPGFDAFCRSFSVVEADNPVDQSFEVFGTKQINGQSEVEPRVGVRIDKVEQELQD